MPAVSPSSVPAASRWQRFSAAAVRGFHAYANWLVGISWRRFFLLSVLLLIAAGLLSEVPPFNYRWTEVRVDPTDARPHASSSAKDRSAGPSEPGLEIRIDRDGVRIGPAASGTSGSDGSAARGPRVLIVPPAPPSPPSSSPPTVPAVPAPSDDAASARPVLPSITVPLPPGADADEIRSAIEEARQDITDELRKLREVETDAGEDNTRISTKIDVRVGEWLPNLALLFIVASAIVKINYKGRLQAEVKAAQATETAESESLRRQVIEARMAAMQAQVEPHFLFNTLASIDHLIEVDPPRASVMQKHLIALLRASMPTMREANGQAGSSGNLQREMAVVRPYLEILKLRMEERLQVALDVPEGLLSADMPPMMIQSLVENAVKHGLEPKPEGGTLSVRAEIEHGRLVVTVADTGLGFGRGQTSGTGVGLANIRERLALLYGTKARLDITENTPSGTRIAITLPYRIHEEDAPMTTTPAARAAAAGSSA